MRKRHLEASSITVYLRCKCSSSYLRDDQFKRWLELLNVSCQTVDQLSSFVGIKKSYILSETNAREIFFPSTWASPIAVPGNMVHLNDKITARLMSRCYWMWAFILQQQWGILPEKRCKEGFSHVGRHSLTHPGKQDDVATGQQALLKWKPGKKLCSLKTGTYVDKSTGCMPRSISSFN